MCLTYPFTLLPRDAGHLAGTLHLLPMSATQVWLQENSTETALWQQFCERAADSAHSPIFIEVKGCSRRVRMLVQVLCKGLKHGDEA